MQPGPGLREGFVPESAGRNAAPGGRCGADDAVCRCWMEEAGIDYRRLYYLVGYDRPIWDENSQPVNNLILRFINVYNTRI